MRTHKLSVAAFFFFSTCGRIRAVLHTHLRGQGSAHSLGVLVEDRLVGLEGTIVAILPAFAGAFCALASFGAVLGVVDEEEDEGDGGEDLIARFCVSICTFVLVKPVN